MDNREQMIAEWDTAMAGVSSHPAVATILASLRRLRATGKIASEETVESWRQAASRRPVSEPELLDAELACLASMR